MTKNQRQALKDRVWLNVAFAISELGTCARRQVGVVFLDKQGHVIATGHNGTAPGHSHCIDKPCAGANCPSGTGLELCEAIHAEQNAIAQTADASEIHTVYCTDSPCIHCVKMLATTGAQRIVFARLYPHSTSEGYWRGHGGLWHHRPIPSPNRDAKTSPRPQKPSFRGWLANLLGRV